MIPRPFLYAFVGAALVGGLAVALLLGTESCQKAKGDQGQHQADIAKGEANAHESKAVEASAEAKKRDPELVRATATITQLTDELARLRRQPKPVAGVGPGSPSPAAAPAVEPVVDLAPIVAKQDELIQAQVVKINLLELQNHTLTVRGDEYKAESEALRRQVAGLEIALDAQKSLTAKAVWRGRIEGFAVGLAVGYVAKR